MSTWIPHDHPTPPDIDAQAEADERLWEHYCTTVKRLDVGELIAAICEQIRSESGDTPLAQLIEDWRRWPQFDWQRPLITPMQAESVGRWLAGIAAQVMAHAIAQALARED
jgi:hypothetical protein